jgi:hypothetical protein
MPEETWPWPDTGMERNLIDNFSQPGEEAEAPPQPHELQGSIDHTAPEEL